MAHGPKSLSLGLLALAGMLASSTVAYAIPCGGSCDDMVSSGCCADDEVSSETTPPVRLKRAPLQDSSCCQIGVDTYDDFPLEAVTSLEESENEALAIAPLTIAPILEPLSRAQARAPPTVPLRRLATKTIVLLL